MRNPYRFAALLLVATLLLVGCDSTSSSAVSAGEPSEGRSFATGLPVSSSYPPGLLVVGTGTVEADPDIAHLTVGIDLKGSDPAAIVADASSRMERILAAVQTSGVAEDDIRTTAYNLWVEPRYNPDTGRPTGEQDYRISHSVRITVRNLDQVGTILAEAVNAGANKIGNVSFSVEDSDALVDQARNQALVDAREKAQSMATTLDVTLGQVISVSESGGGGAIPYPMAAPNTRGEAAAVPLPSGSFSVSISVVVVYDLP